MQDFSFTKEGLNHGEFKFLYKRTFSRINFSKRAILKDENLITLIKNASLEVIKAYKNGNKTLLAGNGGSAADAQHIAGNL